MSDPIHLEKPVSVRSMCKKYHPGVKAILVDCCKVTHFEGPFADLEDSIYANEFVGTYLEFLHSEYLCDFVVMVLR